MTLKELIARVEEDELENIRGDFDGMWTELQTRDMLPAIREAKLLLEEVESLRRLAIPNAHREGGSVSSA